MDTPPLSDSESEESLVSDQEVGGSGARGQDVERELELFGTDAPGSVVAGCFFPRTPEARPQCCAREAEEGGE